MSELYILGAAFVVIAGSLAWMTILLKRELLDPVVDQIAGEIR